VIDPKWIDPVVHQFLYAPLDCGMASACKLIQVSHCSRMSSCVSAFLLTLQVMPKRSITIPERREQPEQYFDNEYVHLERESSR
jgi:hypothetical protein